MKIVYILSATLMAWSDARSEIEITNLGKNPTTEMLYLEVEPPSPP